MSFLKAILLSCCLVPIFIFAQGYPNKTVKIVVPFAAGGVADNYARFIAQRLQDELKQTFIVDDKPGAGSIIGTDFVAKSPADGYTLLVMSNAQTVNESLVEVDPEFWTILGQQFKLCSIKGERYEQNKETGFTFGRI